jgi:hypothetical protein
MLYFVAGVARSGKTSVSRQFLKETGIPYFPLDALMMGFANGLPEMGLDSEADEWKIAGQLWPVIRSMAVSLDEEHIDYMFEGAQLLPADINALAGEMEYGLRACFLGFADLDPAAKLSQIRQYGGGLDDWMRHLEDEWVLNEAKRLIIQSQELRQACARYSLCYIETGLDLAATVQKAIQYLKFGFIP